MYLKGMLKRGIQYKPLLENTYIPLILEGSPIVLTSGTEGVKIQNQNLLNKSSLKQLHKNKENPELPCKIAQYMFYYL